MPVVQDVERAVAQLSAEEMRIFRAWFAEYDARLWDRQFDDDASRGRLDSLADEALDDIRRGRGIDL